MGRLVGQQGLAQPGSLRKARLAGRLVTLEGSHRKARCAGRLPAGQAHRVSRVAQAGSCPQTGLRRQARRGGRLAAQAGLSRRQGCRAGRVAQAGSSRKLACCASRLARQDRDTDRLVQAGSRRQERLAGTVAQAGSRREARRTGRLIAQAGSPGAGWLAAQADRAGWLVVETRTQARRAGRLALKGLPHSSVQCSVFSSV